MSRYFCNPFFIYGVSFLLIIILLSLGVSNLYFLEYNSLLILIFGTILSAFLMGYIFRDYIQIKIHKSFNILQKVSTINCIFIVTLLFVFFLIDCTSVGVIPIVEVIRGGTIDIRNLVFRYFMLF